MLYVLSYTMKSFRWLVAAVVMDALADGAVSCRPLLGIMSMTSVARDHVYVFAVPANLFFDSRR